jgi:hypothetical protein
MVFSLFLSLMLIVASTLGADQKFTFVHDVPGTLECDICNLAAPTIKKDGSLYQKCVKLHANKEVSFDRDELSSVGYFAICPVGITAPEDTERIHMEGFINSHEDTRIDPAMSQVSNIVYSLSTYVKEVVKQIRLHDTHNTIDMVNAIHPKVNTEL